MRQKSLEERLGLRIVGREHDEDQYDRIDEHTVVVERAQCLGQDRQRRGGDERAQMLPGPPSTTNTSTRMERLKLNFVAWREE